MQHYFIDQKLKLNEEIALPADIYQHAVTVLRMKIGDHFELVDSAHKTFVVEICKLEGKSATAKAIKKLETDNEMPLGISIACGVPKNDKKADLVIEKGTEMGAERFIFFPSQYAVGKWRPNKVERKLTRLQKKVRSAAEQSHRNMVPEVEYIQGIDDLIKLPADYKIVAYEESAKQGEASQLHQQLEMVKNDIKAGKHPSMLAVFGPEGGIAPEEIQKYKAAGFAVCGLGPRILRTESAPLYFLSAVSYATELS